MRLDVARLVLRPVVVEVQLHVARQLTFHHQEPVVHRDRHLVADVRGAGGEEHGVLPVHLAVCSGARR